MQSRLMPAPFTVFRFGWSVSLPLEGVVQTCKFEKPQLHGKICVTYFGGLHSSFGTAAIIHFWIFSKRELLFVYHSCSLQVPWLCFKLSLWCGSFPVHQHDDGRCVWWLHTQPCGRELRAMQGWLLHGTWFQCWRWRCLQGYVLWWLSGFSMFRLIFTLYF